MRYLLERLAVSPEAARGIAVTFDLEAAVAEQIQRIVSSRPPVPADGAGSVLGHGMPSVVELSRDNLSELEGYAVRLRQMIAHYEPRLRNLEVNLEPVAGNVSSSWRLIVSGSLTPDDDARTFRFELMDN